MQIQIDVKTLQVAIQAVAEESRRLIEAAKDQDELWILAHDYELAAEALKEAYGEAAKTVLNLTPYHLLVGESESSGGMG